MLTLIGRYVIPTYARIQESCQLCHSGVGQNPGTLPSVEKHPCVYILASGRNGTLYLGVTSDLVKRVWEHKNDLVDGFTKHYNVHSLVWFEMHASMLTAIEREKAIKYWQRKWKLRLIESSNPDWRDLYFDLV